MNNSYSAVKNNKLQVYVCQACAIIMDRKIDFQRRESSRLQVSLLPSLRRLSCIEKTNFQRLKNIFGWPSASSGCKSVNPSADSPPNAATAAKLAGQLLSACLQTACLQSAFQTVRSSCQQSTCQLASQSRRRQPESDQPASRSACQAEVRHSD